MNTRHLLRLALPATLLLPTAALAHPGHDAAGAGFMAGLVHPLGGLDHVLMIVAVGAWAAVLAPAGRWLVAASLGLFVAVGALLPVAAGAGLEVALALTVAAACLLLARGRRWPAWSGASLAGLFALVHGFAHGAEGPPHQALYVPGLVVATSGLALAASMLVARWQAGRRPCAVRR
jgi:urease accessory protein